MNRKWKGLWKGVRIWKGMRIWKGFRKWKGIRIWKGISVKNYGLQSAAKSTNGLIFMRRSAFSPQDPLKSIKSREF